MNKQEWLKPAIQTKGGGCVCCFGTPNSICLSTKLYFGFGGWVVKNNNEIFYMDDTDSFEDCKSLADIEEIIGNDDINEYIAELDLPLRGATFQRHEKNLWVLIYQNNGFA